MDRHMDVAEGRLSYRVRGAGRRVLLVHAGVFGGWFEGLWDEGALDGLELIDYRRIGYGPSSRPDQTPSIADHAQHAAALLDRLGPATVVAHSSGCLVALELAAARPDLTEGLVLLEPALTDVPSHARLGAQVVGPAMGRFKAGDVAGALDTFMAGLCGPGWRPVFESRFGEEARAGALADAAWFFAHETPAILGWRWDEPRLGQIACPVLLLEGTDSTAVNPVFGEQVERAAALLPKAERAEVPGTHMAPLQFPAAMAERIAGFVADRVPLAIS